MPVLLPASARPSAGALLQVSGRGGMDSDYHRSGGGSGRTSCGDAKRGPRWARGEPSRNGLRDIRPARRCPASTSNLHYSGTHWALVRPRRIVSRLRHPAASRAKPYTVASHMHRLADMESLKVGDKIVDLAHARLVVLVQDGLDRLAPSTSSGIHGALEHPPVICFLPGLLCRR